MWVGNGVVGGSGPPDSGIVWWVGGGCYVASLSGEGQKNSLIINFELSKILRNGKTVTDGLRDTPSDRVASQETEKATIQ